MTQSGFQATTCRYLLTLIGLLTQVVACSDAGDGANPIRVEVDAGAALTIVMTDVAELDATVTTNGLAATDNTTYAWTKISGPGSVNFSHTDSEDTTASFSDIGSYVLALTATSGGVSASDTTDITVNLKASGVSGLTSRPTNASACVAPATPALATGIRLVNPFPSLPRLTAPVAIMMAPGNSSHWYVVQQTGQVVRFANAFGASTVSSFIDINDGRLTYGGEMGLLGMAFHPDFASNGYVYLSYTSEIGGRASRISRFNLDPSGQALDPASEQIILSVAQPYANHNGGHIAFGPDNYLYIGLGDGGSGGDPLGHGQNTDTLLGSMLRIDVGDGSSGSYTIPIDNPFVSGGGRAEIFAYGLRNPWRWSFDRGSGELWLGDVGQNMYEEINLISKGGNFGWNIMEGMHCYNAASCDQTGLILPLAEYDHSQGFAVTGGYVYRGSDIDLLRGRYLYADFSTGRIWALQQTGPNQYAPSELMDTNLNIASFAEDHDGEIYVVDLGGSILKISGDSGGQAGQIPALLSDWGCFQAGDATRFSNHVIPYSVNAPLWSDDGDKVRFMAIPDGTHIDIDDQGRLQLPVGSILGKNFYLDDRIIETRLLLHYQQPHGWKGYSYEWNDAQTQAALLATAKDKDINGQIWHYPSRAECDACHTPIAGFTLGPKIAQLNRSFNYADTGIDANQLITLESIEVLSRPLSDAEKSTTLYAIDNTAYSAELRARSYLHANCANCHQPGGPGGGDMDLRFATPLDEAGICNTAPLGDTLGLINPAIVSPGNADQSVLVLRMEDNGVQRMPPLASAIVDDQALAVIRAWIDQLEDCGSTLAN
ncbi:MAG: hypothetical protein HKP12_08425 [Gammaproteobacteria bacterium]|nr:hypothetical protein [Gammaproteobacteria bacterium]